MSKFKMAVVSLCFGLNLNRICAHSKSNLCFLWQQDVLINLKNNLEYYSQSRSWSTSVVLPSSKKFEKPGFKVQKVVTEDGVTEIKKKTFIPRISLFSTDDSMQVLTLDEAQKIAARRNLKLQKIQDLDPKSGRPVYKLLSASDLAAFVKSKKVEKKVGQKDEKLLNIATKTTDHDLQPKIKHIIKWLEKEQPIRVVITGDSTNLAPAERICSLIGESIKDSGRVVQKITKGGEIKFQILPPKKLKKKAPSENNEKEDAIETDH